MITDKDEPTKKEALELAEDFTDWMGASWPMCGGINATAKLATMANKRFRTTERLAKIEVLESAKIKARECYFPQYVYDLLDDMIAELKEAKR